jgi:hypothetical protein
LTISTVNMSAVAAAASSAASGGAESVIDVAL